MHHSPIFRLPNELLAIIFNLGSFLDSSFPILVASVSVRWRWTAINTPDVWTNIVIHTRSCGARALTELFLKRSGNCPVDICVIYDQKHVLTEIEEVSRLLVAHARRWRSLILKGYVTERHLTILSRACPSEYLAHLCISTDAGVMGPHNPSELLHSTHTINTNYLQLIGSTCPWAVKGLRRLHLCRVRITCVDFHDLLSSSPCLSELIMEDLHLVNRDPSVSLAHIELFHLTSLSLKFTTFTVMPIISPFIHVSFPYLQRLDLGGTQLPSTLTAFFGGRNAQWGNLKALRLSHLRVVPQSMDTVFAQRLESIQSLEFIQSPMELLFPTTQTRQRSNSIGKRVAMFRMQTVSSKHVNIVEKGVWPHLNTIVLDSFAPDDMSKLFSLVRLRPHLTLKLSKHARRQIPKIIDGVEGVLWLKNRCERLVDL